MGSRFSVLPAPLVDAVLVDGVVLLIVLLCAVPVGSVALLMVLLDAVPVGGPVLLMVLLDAVRVGGVVLPALLLDAVTVGGVVRPGLLLDAVPLGDIKLTAFQALLLALPVVCRALPAVFFPCISLVACLLLHCPLTGHAVASDSSVPAGEVILPCLFPDALLVGIVVIPAFLLEDLFILVVTPFGCCPPALGIDTIMLLSLLLHTLFMQAIICLLLSRPTLLRRMSSVFLQHFFHRETLEPLETAGGV